ncbi:cytochrome c oxidase subunit 3 [Parvularcula dongshanensis]|uniref:cytochrome-c oxidase n=1 Tax=Parvularcula dongshanensis TaxID=1173995 RepID=A0A840I3J8_9PROT|nr:cytochrome c oxidase subunit 3 [Parvularcula dongshanensis]MBB4658758.1 cytochrome c oxidase subunit 3 [Parvularcula dongshanensis]
MAGDVKHDYHLVSPSPWPLVGSISAMVMMLGAVVWRYSAGGDQTLYGMSGAWVFFVGLLGVLFTMAGWWRDVVAESMRGENTSAVVRIGLRYGMVLFILSEVMFFVAWFWAFFAGALFPDAGPAIVLSDGSQMLNAEGLPAYLMNDAKFHHLGGQWPPQGVEPLAAWGLPLVNTIILLLSGTTVTWAHHAMQIGDRQGFKVGMIVTIALGAFFSCLQAVEYFEALRFNMFAFGNGSVYGATFFMATGFHGLHVIIGTLFLLVCLIRGLRHQFTPERHFGFEAAAWYWHFVDVVWLFLFAAIYVLGNEGLLS